MIRKGIRRLKFRTPKIRRYKVKVKRIGRLKAFLDDFNTGVFTGIRDSLRERYGWSYCVTYAHKIIQVRWFWSYSACVKAVQKDVSQGYVDPNVFIKMQYGERVASMTYDIRKEQIR